MKKILYLLLFFLTILFSYKVIYAEELLTKKDYIIEEDSQTLQTIGLKDSYITLNTIADKTIINKYNNQNVLVASKQLDNLVSSNIKNYNDNFIVYGKNNNVLSIFVLDTNLKILNAKETDILVDNNCKINLYLYNDNIYLLLTDEGTLFDNNLYKLDHLLNTNSKKISSYDNSELISILKSDYHLIHLSRNIVNDVLHTYLESDYIENYNVLVGYSDSSLITLLDKNGTTLWTKNNENYQKYLNVKFINNKIVLLALKDGLPYLIIYDITGKIEQEIPVSENSYEIAKLSTINNKLAIILNNHNVNRSLTNSMIITYEFLNSININSENYGTVEAVSEANPYEEVKIDVVPNSGYEVASILVKDEKGNKIDINNNAFIMPQSSVTVSITYKTSLDNPETTDFIFILSIIFIIAIIFTRTLYKKLKWLN